MDRNETLADIVAEMRKRVKKYEGAFWMDRIPDAPIAVIYRDFADRIEAAWKCERDELVAKAESEKRWANHYFEEWQKNLKWDEAAFNEAASRPNGWDAVADQVAEIRRMRGEVQVGNAANLREALENIRRFVSAWIAAGVIDKSMAKSILVNCDAALAVQPRNCDVGTAEEQAHRFFAFCHAHRAFDTACSDDCPFKDAPDINHCQSGWAQLPYEAPAAQEGGE